MKKGIVISDQKEANANRKWDKRLDGADLVKGSTKGRREDPSNKVMGILEGSGFKEGPE